MAGIEAKDWVTKLDDRASHLEILCAVWFVMAQDAELIEWVKKEQNTFVFNLLRQSLHKDIVGTIYTFLDKRNDVISLKNIVQQMKDRDQTIQIILEELNAVTVSAEFSRLKDVRNYQIGHAGKIRSESKVRDVWHVAEQVIHICRKLKTIYDKGDLVPTTETEFMRCRDYWKCQVRKQFGMRT